MPGTLWNCRLDLELNKNILTEVANAFQEACNFKYLPVFSLILSQCVSL